MSDPALRAAVTVAEGDLTSTQLDRLLASRRIAIDTETSGLDWAEESLQLCQLYSPQVGAVLVRPSSVRTPTNLARLLEHPEPVKVFHFAPFDLQFIQAAWGVTVKNIRCTKTAHKLLEPTASSRQHSLSALTEQYLGIGLDKGSVRTSNWAAARLSEEQIRYATGDVVHLIPLLDRLEFELAKVGRAELFLEVCRYLPIGVELQVRGFPNPFDY